MTRLVWHRGKDLRLDDNELYHNEKKGFCISLYVIDPSLYQPRTACYKDLKSVTHGPHYSCQLIQALKSLRCRLQQLGGDLLLHRGSPALVIPQIVQSLRISEVAWSDLPGVYERKEAEQVRCQLSHLHPPPRIVTASITTLFDPAKLPNNAQEWATLARPKEKRKMASKVPLPKGIERRDLHPERLFGMPHIMGDFRRAARSAAPIKNPLHFSDTQDCVYDVPDSVDRGELPTLEELTSSFSRNVSILGIPSWIVEHVVECAGMSDSSNGEDLSETSAMCHLNEFIDKHAAHADRNLADTSSHNSSRLSVFLSLGILSPRQVYHAAAEKAPWLQSHMEMRDFFLYNVCRLDKNAFLLEPPLRAHKPSEPIRWKPWGDSGASFESWVSGQTGLPLVDAAMRELMTTGYCSNRVRQNAASILTKDLCIDWRVGAEWFQFCLKDHCVGANYGNWMYFSGVGPDPKNRHFRTISQALRYDSEGAYVKKWIPELAQQNDVEVLLRPWAYGVWEQHSILVNEDSQLTWSDKERLRAVGRLVPKTSLQHSDEL